jgi:hypothetical protein
MRKLLIFAVMAHLLVFNWQASAAAKKKAPAKKPAAAKTSTAPKSTAKKSTASRTTAARGTTRKSTKKPASKITWRNRQTSPAPERYREIQEALTAKGYLQASEIDGSWNGASAEALKRFQADQKLDSNGKINALSLIALGLGPKRNSAAAQPENPPPPADR